MKKVLIVSYFSPPSNFAGSYRVRGWLDHFHKFGYHPVLITRHWKGSETEFTAISEETDILLEENNTSTIIRLPYRGSLRDRIVARAGAKAAWLGKVFSLFQVVGQNFFLFCIPYRNLYYQARKYLRDNPDVEFVLTTGRPFVQFRFAHLLKKEFPNIRWIADYRDPWNSDITIDESFSRRVQRFLNIHGKSGGRHPLQWSPLFQRD
jgi:hypothetical protein